jgi:hypothetical protein
MSLLVHAGFRKAAAFNGCFAGKSSRAGYDIRRGVTDVCDVQIGYSPQRIQPES